MGVLTAALGRVDDYLAVKDPNNRFLSGKYAPVDWEVLEPQECKVEGNLPAALDGEFARNGPNPRLTPTSGYHWFDGDGFVHAVRMKGGRAMYTCRYVDTVRLQRELAAGRPLYIKFGDLSDKWALSRVMMDKLKRLVGVAPRQEDTATSPSTANTSLHYHAGRLLALNEGDVPYALKVLCDGVLETIGKVTFDGKLQTPFTAHPKIDPETGYMYAFGYQTESKPYVRFHVIDPKGRLERTVPVDIPRPVMMHDFSTTDRHAIFLDFPLCFDGQVMAKEGRLPVVFKKHLPARFGVLSLNATDSSGMRWFPAPETVVCMHTLNSWEEPAAQGETTLIHVFLCQMPEFDLQKMMEADAKLDFRNELWHYTIDMKADTISGREVVRFEGNMALDFPQLNRTLVGRQCRYGYVTLFDPKHKGDPVGVGKVELLADSMEAANLGQILFGDNRYGGECMFIPAEHPQSEDDGFLATFVIDEETGASDLCVWDARTMDPNPVARVVLPKKVPLGFHATFVSASELSQEMAAAA